jgi:hypothetical protein
VADTPSPPSPEILEKLRQLREELAQKAAQQAPKDANTLAWQQSNAFKRVYPRANGGQIKATQSDPEIDALFREPSLTMDERFRKYVAPVVREGLNSGLDAMLPMRGLAREAFKKGVFLPVANFYKKNANDLDDADVQGKVEEYKRMKEMELRNKIGLRQLPVEHDLSKFSRRLIPNSFPNPDNPIEVPKSLERDWTELLSQPKAKGGVIDMDRMRLELINKAKGGSVMGVNVASDRKHNLNYADLIVDGHKTIESRNSDTLRPYVGKRVAIVRTGAGKAKAIGEVTIGEPIVANKKQFRNMESHHLVPEGSTFDIKTPTKHMYPLSEPVRYDEERDVGHGILSRKVIHEAKGGSVPKNTVKAYKLFRVHPKHPGKLFPLFVNANEPVEMNKWVDAKEGEMAGDKVKSKIGPLAYRPGWHAGDLPVATHIGEKSDPNLTAPDVRPANHVWAEVEMPHDVDWQSVANERGMNPKGKLIARNAHITDQIPKGGHYRYKTNSNMTGNWLIGGSMKVNRVLQDKEVKAINKAAGAADLPRTRPFKAKDYGFASGGVVAPEEFMAEEHVNYNRSGGATHAHHLDIEERPL